MEQELKKMAKWREKMDKYRSSISRKEFIADIKKAGFTVKDRPSKSKK